jgi:hypothetical protein
LGGLIIDWNMLKKGDRIWTLLKKLSIRFSIKVLRTYHWNTGLYKGK